jgi:hypothetical protein
VRLLRYSPVTSDDDVRSTDTYENTSDFDVVRNDPACGSAYS